MLVSRLLPILLIGGGYLICKAIFTAHPFNKGSLSNKNIPSQVILRWSFAFLIILVQIIYTVKSLSNLFLLSSNVVVPFLIIPILIMTLYAFFIFNKK